ncbi:TIGR03643 family protein [Marinomonas sp. THO17]|uniref:TIGR03643 family protein n=1 Tax=Marinomonas sp. THO17 TaxID=3149048 RepID=UPI00336C1E8A
MSLFEHDISRVIEMAWEDRTPFEAITKEYGLSESEVIKLMRSEMKAASFRMWRKRVSGRKTKHLQYRSPEVIRAYSPSQYKPR